MITHPIFKFSNLQIFPPSLKLRRAGKLLLAASLLLGSIVLAAQSPSKVKESTKVFKTYPFSDPDPIPRMGNIYPYFRFDGYTDRPIDKSWKVVELENDYISVMILPEIGGKIWSATEKSTGKNFLYYNHVVKFRDIAMRGPWTSGGIEANYGIIGHTPNCATPVDYLTRSNADGSVSCFIGTLDLLTRTYWTIEINLPKDKAYFTTRSFWSNTTPMEQPYYTWMNVGLKASGNLEFIYPGTRYLGHDGSNHAWPIHENGRNISFYEQNDFGPYKSYHVFGKYTDFFGAYWHTENFGMGRYAPHVDKAGKKIWIWGLSQQGMIWEKLLSDTDGQYVEVQSGRLYNQTDHTSSITPFKHRGFAPYSTDTWTEHWFPVKGTQGFVTAGPAGAMNVRSRKGFARIDLCPLGALNERLVVTQGDRKIYEKTLSLKALQVFTDSVSILTTTPFTVSLGDHLLDYNSDPKDGVLARPLESPTDFDWSLVHGLYLEGKEFVRERQYAKAAAKLEECLAKDPNYLPALRELGMVLYRNIDYAAALKHLMRALSIDTYDPQANFYYGLTQAALGNHTDAKDGLDIAAQSPDYRSAAYVELSRISIMEGRHARGLEYALRSLESNAMNMEAYRLVCVSYRLQGKSEQAAEATAKLISMMPLDHAAAFELNLTKPSKESESAFTSTIRNELPVETYLEIASWYSRIGLWKDARSALNLAPVNAEVLYWQAYIDKKLGLPFDESLKRALNSPVEGVFPFRAESAAVFSWAAGATDSWRPKYFLGLIYWNSNRLDKAREMFTMCANKPEFSPFYAARAELIKETALQDLQKASALYPNQWRYGKLLVQHYVGEKKYTDALRVARDYDRRLPNDFRLRLLLAKTQLLTGDYAGCVMTLNGTNVLPYEGSTEGHSLYREALLMQAVERLKAKKYAEALTLVTKAREYPGNLGVGRPYEENIDSRVESFLEGLCHEGLKKPDNAKTSWSAVTSQNQVPGINNLVTAWAFRKLGNAPEGEALLQAWSSRAAGPLPTWCLDIFGNKASAWEPGSDIDGSRVVRELVLLVR